MPELIAVLHGKQPANDAREETQRSKVVNVRECNDQSATPNRQQAEDESATEPDAFFLSVGRFHA